MNEIVCRRAGCRNLLSDEDEKQGYEHCSPECCEACEDLEPDEYAEKQASHDIELQRVPTNRKRP